MEEATGLAVEKTRSFFVRCRIDAPRYGLYEDEIRSVEEAARLYLIVHNQP